MTRLLRTPLGSGRVGRLLAALALAGLVGGTVPAVSDSPASAGADGPAPAATLPTGIEAFAPYVGQASCDPIAKPGMVRLADLLIDYYGGTNWGITRACAIGGQSEHKEGRAFDWKLNYFDSADRDRAERFLSWLLAPGPDGVVGGMARRLGISYVIWNKKIWSSSRYDEGWRDYYGASPHQDHIHISLSWAGAMGRTSFWTGKVARDDYGPCAVYAGDPAVIRTGFNGQPCPEPSPAPYSVNRPMIWYGSAGDDVSHAQRELGIYADGSFGPLTRQAVIDFQRARGLPVTGAVDAITWAKLDPSTVVSINGEEMPAETPLLRMGSTGDDVKRLQKQLGMARSMRDGVFGPITEGYVTDFQRTVGIRVTGTSTRATWKALQPMSGTVLYPGDSGDAVLLLQRRLNLPLRFRTGFFSQVTADALVAFKARHGLPEWPVAGKSVRAWLRM